MSESECTVANVVEEKPKLVLAPLPTKSPWEETNQTGVKSLNLSEIVAAKNKQQESHNKSRSKVTPSITGKEKWVPLTADIVVKDKISDGFKTKKAKSKARKEKPKSKTKPKTKDIKQKKDQEEQKQQKKQERGQKTRKEESNNENKFSSKTSSAAENENSKVASLSTEQHEKKQEKSHPSNRRFTPYSKPFIPKGENGVNHPSNTQSHSYHQSRNNTNHGKIQRGYSQGRSFYQHSNAYTPSFVLVAEIARQIQYYFSIENLSKDLYLRSQMNGEGYVPLALISRFHRMLNLSFGDVGLILAALRELKVSPESNIEISKLAVPFEDVPMNPLFQYALRSTVWTSENSQDSLQFQTLEIKDDELELFKIEPINPPMNSTHGLPSSYKLSTV